MTAARVLLIMQRRAGARMPEDVCYSLYLVL